MANSSLPDRSSSSFSYPSPSVPGEKEALLKQNGIQVNLDAPEMCSSKGILYHLHTLLLFTYSDIKAVIVPQALFALSFFFSHHDLTTGTHALPRITILFTSWRVPHMLLWLWLHLLILDLANQRLASSITEDAVNKPWRPLPAKRLSPIGARTMLLLVIPLAMSFSLVTCQASYVPSATLICLAWLYNDLEGSSTSIFARNLLNALGLTCFGWGALAVLAGPGAQLVLPQAAVWMAMTASIIFTTIQVQDFRDEAGDRECGRETIALRYSPVVARGSCALFVLMWSLAAPAFWACNRPGSAALSSENYLTCAWWVWAVSVGLGAGVGGLLMARGGRTMDEQALTAWCAWVAWVYMLPLFV